MKKPSLALQLNATFSCFAFVLFRLACLTACAMCEKLKCCKLTRDIYVIKYKVMQALALVLRRQMNACLFYYHLLNNPGAHWAAINPSSSHELLPCRVEGRCSSVAHKHPLTSSLEGWPSCSLLSRPPHPPPLSHV